MFGPFGLEFHTPRMIQKLETWVKKEEVVKNCDANSKEEVQYKSFDSQKSSEEIKQIYDLRQKV
jgi:hypothetical protein